MPSKHSTIHFIFTGGTIDSFYDGTKDTVVALTHSALPQFLRSLRLYNKLVLTEICMKDSRNLTENDLEKISATVKKSPHKYIVITHGTYTIGDTARFLEARLKKNKTVIITGSMLPITGFAPSDAPFNLGYAVAQVQTLRPGVYVAMNGRIFTPREVAKEIKRGRFFSVLGEK